MKSCSQFQCFLKQKFNLEHLPLEPHSEYVWSLFLGLLYDCVLQLWTYLIRKLWNSGRQ